MIYVGVVLAVLAAIVANFRIVRGGYSDDYLSLEITKAEKGIAAILILLHHMSQHVEVPPAATIMRYIGFIMVAVFFFISGYGLMKGFRHKENYLDGFLKRRLIPVMIPYWIVNLVEIVIRLLEGKKYMVLDYVLSFLGFDTVSSCWFVVSIMIMYVLFWIAFKYFMKNSLLALVSMVIAYCVIFTIMGLHSSYTASVGAFLFGVYWEKVEIRLIPIIRKYYAISLVACVIGFTGLFFGRLILANKGIDQDVLHLVLRNICSIAFVILLLAVTQKICFPGSLLKFLGDNSYELYLVQRLTIPILTSVDNGVGILLVFTLTIMMGWGLHKVSVNLKTTLGGVLA